MTAAQMLDKHAIETKLKNATDLLFTDPQRASQLASSALNAPKADALQRIAAMTLIGKADFALGYPETGFANLQDAIDQAHREGFEEEEARILVSLGERITHVCGDLNLGMQTFEKARAIAERLDHQRLLAHTLSAMGPLLGRMGRMGECESMLRSALNRLDPVQDQALRMTACLNLAFLFVEGERLEEALQLLQSSEPQLRKCDAMKRNAYEQVLGKAYAKVGRFDEAIAVLDRQFMRLKGQQDHYTLAGNRVVMGFVLVRAGRADEAVTMLREAHRYTRQHSLHAVEIEVLQVLTKACEATGDLEQALKAERDLRRLTRQMIDRETAERARIAEALARLNEERVAKQALTQANAELERQVLQRTQALQQEVEERGQAERMARHWAEHDWLTGLGNRSYLDQQLHAMMRDALRDSCHLAVLFIDLDGFKLVNDGFGHPMGDRVLSIIARRLKRSAPEGSVVARFGGDEFVVVLPAQPTLSQVRTDAQQFALKLQQRLARPVHSSNGTVQLSASVGIALGPMDADTPDELIRQADRAMLQAKKSGGAQAQMLDVITQQTLDRQGIVRRDLHQAISEQHLEPWLQPVVDARTGTMRHIELLARWMHPQLGDITPAEFVPLAEETGLIEPLGDWALRAAVQAALQLQHQGLPIISVNLSPRLLSDAELAQRYGDLVRAAGLLPQGLRFELTESVQLAEDPQCMHNLELLRAQGFSLALDDFGAGYSSFNYLSRLRFEQVKIDQSMVLASCQGGRSQTVMRSVVAMAQALGMEVVAEGIETDEQLAHVIAQGCNLVQGFLVGRPMPLQGLKAWLAERSHRQD